ncbi:MAG: SpoVA/SpoVAEb family sporulation membrane protein [Butyricicoccus sp.]|nr:SpoVA/SpoVAEb family sporulation membrane protein [Butyricicoccus sp.]
MKLTKAEYQKMLERRAPRSPIGRDVLWAAVVGGAICVVGQSVINFYQGRGLDTDSAAAATSITMIFLGGLFTALHLYDKLAKRAGAGTIVPITGFANAVIAPAIEFKTEGFILGTAAKMFAVAGPVIVYGVTASVIYGLILFYFGG